MNKFFKGLISVGLCGSIVTGIAFAAGCGGQKLDPEARAFSLAIGALNNNFNPFFSTSQNDSEIASMTQSSLITSDENGNEAYGDNWPTVALDYRYKFYNAQNQESSAGDVNGTTEYSFIIKNGMKFSDGTDLTIHDVLFNFYVYLDPAYDGSNTMYSTDIVGLKSYWAQESIGEDDTLDNTSQYYAEATARINELVRWSNDSSLSLSSQMEEDLATVKELFREEAENDWTSIETGWKNTYVDVKDGPAYYFNAAWQAYYYREGIVQDQTRKNPTTGNEERIKDAAGNYLTTLDDIADGALQTKATHLIEEMEEACSEANVNKYMKDNKIEDRDYALLQVQKEFAINKVVDNYTERGEIKNVLSYWGTASTAVESFMGDARKKFYDEKTQSGQLAIPNISGITVTKTSTDFSGKNIGEHDVLNIKINGIDPKAVWNFAIPIAPMAYYSDGANGTYTKAAMAADVYDKNCKDFGVKLGDSTWFKQVMKTKDKNQLPVGAGTYKATSYDGGTVTGTSFFHSNIVYFERNTYFETMGANISNAKIKYLRYSVTADDQILSALKTKAIDYGQPSATYDNSQEVSDEQHLEQIMYRTGGYGYVGINPKYVEKQEIRQAIMKSFNSASIITDYYKSAKFAEVIYRPMSATSWAYPKGCTEYETVSYDKTSDHSEIKELLNAAGYTTVGSDGVRQNAAGEKLKFTFTIAGESADHPAYQMFLDSERILEECGFDITVTTDILALNKLNTGGLEVWAAAYTSTIDPDMYQLFHKDSKATSVKNWGYSQILNDQTGEFSYEKTVIDELSEKIDAARQVMDQDTRKTIYADCLDLVMELAVEFPTYQRNDLCVYNKEVLNKDTLFTAASDKMGVLAKIWEVNYV